jgi:hypothetical protein
MIKGGGDTTQTYLYLAGRMTGLPGFNFPQFHEAAETLRNRGENVVNPAELDHEKVRLAAEASVDGNDHIGASWEDCLRRDLEIVINPNCVGVVVLDNWQESKGARFETYTAAALGLPIYEYEKAKQGDWLPIDRMDKLEYAEV